MDYNDIKAQMASINEELNVLNVEDFGEIEACLDVFEFNKISENLKERVQKRQGESDFFKTIFNTQDYYENISAYLQQAKMALYYKIEKAGVSMEANKNLQQSSMAVKNIVDVLVAEYQILSKKDGKKFWRGRRHKQNEIRLLLSDLVALHTRLQKILHVDSKIVSNVILKDFKMIFNSFFNCIKVAKKRNDELLLIEIAGITDKIINMIKPVFSGKSLKTSELIYHYLIYELRELKNSAIGDDVA